ncbi:LuxR C-terminal-related transcriptional regulator [Runella salmonicolor]|uniref:LuxR C-terminal-related transcriptional regulator n=1 Tax=Runella salmonicolor TaxID=2950278 RepID=A0ABT1FN15_9BACT|nr:LuxR C-terminal-related transcriptional regulator [Runella salmonicolor]MCP1383154.1 LuxR C-terminal-related transcriptional regulator [Runella salmonicolor]
MSLILSQKLLALAYQQPRIKPENVQSLAGLTSQEVIVLIHLADDLTAVEIAKAMRIKPKSIANYKERIADKLYLGGCRALRRFAIQHQEFLHLLKKEVMK